MDDDLRTMIRDCIRDTLFEIFSTERGRAGRGPERPFDDKPAFQRLENIADRLTVLEMKMSATTWAAATCGYNASDIGDILQLAKSIDAKT